MMEILLVAIGSAAGGLSRWWVTKYAAHWFGVGFPWGTLIINLTGCVLLGWFSTFLSHRLTEGKETWLHPDELRLLVAVGFTGAYTTFSTFELESYGLLRSGDHLKGMIYVLVSVAAGLESIRLGMILAGAK